MKHLNLEQLARLVDKVKEQCKADYNGDQLRTNHARFSWTRVCRVGNNNTIRSRNYSLTYYLVRHPLVYDFLIQFFKNDDIDLLQPEIELRETQPNLELNEAVLEFLLNQINPSYLHKFYNYNKSKKSTKGEYIMGAPYQTIYNLYLKEVSTRKKVIGYEGFYLSTKGHSIERFYLKIYPDTKRATLEELHDDSSIVYEGPINGVGNQLFLNLTRNELANSEQLNLILNKGKQKLTKLNVVPGSFLGVSYNADISIGGEFILLRRQLLVDSKNTKAGYELNIKQHLNLHRNSFRVYEGDLFNQQRYAKRYGYKLDVLAKFTGNYLVGRLKDRETLVVGVLKLNEDYSASLLHPEIKENTEIYCPITISKVQNKQALLMKIFAESDDIDNPFTVAMIDLPFGGKNKTLLGCFCNIYGDEPIGGNLTLIQLPDGVNGVSQIVNMRESKDPQHMKLWEELVSRNPYLELKKLKKKLFGNSN